MGYKVITWTPPRKVYYCQHDGGQWNVECDLLYELGSLCVIRGKNLVGVPQSLPHEDGMNYLLVSAYEVYDNPQGA